MVFYLTLAHYALAIRPIGLIGPIRPTYTTRPPTSSLPTRPAPLRSSYQTYWTYWTYQTYLPTYLHYPPAYLLAAYLPAYLLALPALPTYLLARPASPAPLPALLA